MQNIIVEGGGEKSREKKVSYHMSTIDDIKNQLYTIKEHVKLFEADAAVALTEINAIINKFDPFISSGNADKLPMVQPEFANRSVFITNKIKASIGEFKIPELRYGADRISQILRIPLPSATRKNKESLLQWFESNWERVEPYLSMISES